MENSRAAAFHFAFRRISSSSEKCLNNNFVNRSEKNDKAIRRGGARCEPCPPYRHSSPYGIDQGHLQSHSPAMAGRRTRRASRELSLSSRQTRALFVQSVVPTHRHRRDQYETASGFLCFEGFVAPQVVYGCAHEVRSPSRVGALPAARPSRCSKGARFALTFRSDGRALQPH